MTAGDTVLLLIAAVLVPIAGWAAVRPNRPVGAGQRIGGGP